jgi:hypothetical protein
VFPSSFGLNSVLTGATQSQLRVMAPPQTSIPTVRFTTSHDFLILTVKLAANVLGVSASALNVHSDDPHADVHFSIDRQLVQVSILHGQTTLLLTFISVCVTFRNRGTLLTAL